MSYVYWIRLHDHVDVDTQGYIGVCKSSNIEVRWARHRREVSKTEGLEYPLYRALRKYGIENTVWTIIFEGAYDKCLQLEQKYRPMPNIGWNIHSGGKSCSPMQGRKHTETSKRQMSITKTGVKRSPESITKQSMTLQGHITPESVRKKISSAQLGKANNGVRARRKSIQASTGEIFESLTAAAKWLCISYTSISKHLTGKYAYAGIHPVTQEKLTWVYLNK